MHFVARTALIVVLVWQAVAGAVRWSGDLRAGLAPVPLGELLAATSHARTQRVLGDDAAIVATLPGLLPPGSIVLAQAVTGSLEELRRTTKDERELIAAFEARSARNGLLIQLTALLFPAPFLVAIPAPIAAIEAEGVVGKERWLCVLPGDPDPHGRAGWTCVQQHPRFSLWRFQKAS